MFSIYNSGCQIILVIHCVILFYYNCTDLSLETGLVLEERWICYRSNIQWFLSMLPLVCYFIFQEHSWTHKIPPMKFVSSFGSFHKAAFFIVINLVVQFNGWMELLTTCWIYASLMQMSVNVQNVWQELKKQGLKSPSHQQLRNGTAIFQLKN